jgi:hypothetical protein
MVLQSVFVVFLAFFGLGCAQFEPDNVVTRWIEAGNNIHFTTGLFSVAFSLRANYMMDMAMFDATAAYSREITPFIATDVPRRNPSFHNDENRSKALSFAAYRILQHIWGTETAFPSIVGALMTDLGYDANDLSTVLTTPSGIGNYVAARVIANRMDDGINENGDHPGTVGGVKYSDWTQYTPVNDPQTVNGQTQCSELKNINRWQPLRYDDQVQVWDGPHIGLQKPFAISSGLDYDFVGGLAGPAFFNTNSEDEAWNQLDEIIDISGNLGDEEKSIGQWWGYNSYNNFVIWLARERELSIVDTVKLAALHGGCELDSSIAAWGLKARFDNARPISQIHCKYAGETIRAYAGPYQGVQDILAEDWQPYPVYPGISSTPNFPDYVSGHSCAAGTVFEAYKRFFGSDDFGFSVTIPAGSSVVEPKVDNPFDTRFQDGITNVPNTGPDTIGYSPAAPVTLEYTTFSQAAVDAALSRMYLGIHFHSASFDGIEVGRHVGAKVFERYEDHLTGKRDLN